MRTKLHAAAFCLAVLCAGFGLAQQSPKEEKGFRPEKLYSFGSLDHVNTFNGNLVFSIPIGMRYPLDGGFTYGLSLTYNSKLWDFDIYEPFLGRGFPSRRSNAGMGWLLSLGRLVPPESTTNPGFDWIYESPDGADHAFVTELLYDSAACTGAFCGGKTHYTRDGSFLRMREISPTLRTVESGDGTTSEFELVSDEWRIRKMYGPYWSTSGVPMNYVNVSYPGPLGIAQCPGASSVWQLQDSKQRTHYVCFTDQDYAGDTVPMVERVVLAGFGENATYFFQYDQSHEISESCEDTYPNDPETAPSKFFVPFLQTLTQPDGTNAACASPADCSRFEFTYFNSGCPTGAIQSVILPTKGRIAYTYGTKNVQENSACPVIGVANTVGVATRTLTEPDPTNENNPWKTIGTWTYDVENVLKGYVTNALCERPGKEPLQPVLRDEAIGWVVDPLGNKFVQHYSVWPGNPGNEVVSPDGFIKNQYGVPIGKYDPTRQANLSREVMEGCNASGANCTRTSRKTYVRYQFEPATSPVAEAIQTVVRERTEYLDDLDTSGNPRYSLVESSDYDGFGHARKTVTSGSFSGDEARTTTATYNAGANDKGSSGGYLVISTGAPWILNTYDRITTSEKTGGSTTSTYCFDKTTGWLRAVRLGDANGAGQQTNANDLITLYTAELFGGASTGNVASERSYGGDGFPLSSGSKDLPLCTIAGGAAPGTLGYRIDHTYAYGRRATSRYNGMPFLSLDQDVHPTGLIWKSRATDGVATTTYTYDRAGRVTRIEAPAQAATQYTYFNASGSGSSFVPARVNATTTSATEGVLQSEYLFDAIGRFTREKTLIGANTWSSRVTAYDALDRQTSVSEPEVLASDTAAPSHKTQYAGYDAFGRAGSITAPDGSITSFTYKGASEMTRTVQIATGGATDTSASTIETYDRLGRLVRVNEPGPSGTIVTSYGYDSSDRLTTVVMADQQRIFDYDGRGLLRWETHPESGMTSYTYDARGHVLTKTQSAANTLFDLYYQYDAAERLLAIYGRNPFYDPAGSDPDQPSVRIMKSFVYGAENSGSDLRLGKLWKAARYNYPATDPGEDVFKVSEQYVYGDAAGRKTERTTIVTNGTGIDEESSDWETYRTITTGVSYNDLNLPAYITYPYCIDCGTAPNPGAFKYQQYTYAYGRLASVPGYVTGFSYWPNGMWHTMSRTNGMTDTQELDASGMARPKKIIAATSTECSVPVFTSDPVGGTVTSTSPVTLSVGVSGTGPFSYKWYNEAGTQVGSNPTFTATSANTTATSDYYVEVTNACLTARSLAATVYVNECMAPSAYPVATPNADGTYTLTAGGGGTDPRTYTWRRASDQTVVGTSSKITVGPLTATTAYTVTVSNGCSGSSPATATVTVTIAAPITAVVTATRPDGQSFVRITWTGPTTGVSYKLQRRGAGTGWVDLPDLSPTALAARTFDDLTAAANYTYAYRLRTDYALSNADVASTLVFPKATSSSKVTVEAFNNLLTALNSVRQTLGWPPVSWTNILSSKDPLPAIGVKVLAIHVAAARARMNEALQALGVPVVPYTNPQLSGVTIRATLLNEIIDRAN